MQEAGLPEEGALPGCIPGGWLCPATCQGLSRRTRGVDLEQAFRNLPAQWWAMAVTSRERRGQYALACTARSCHRAKGLNFGEAGL